MTRRRASEPPRQALFQGSSAIVMPALSPARCLTPAPHVALTNGLTPECLNRPPSQYSAAQIPKVRPVSPLPPGPLGFAPAVAELSAAVARAQTASPPELNSAVAELTSAVAELSAAFRSNANSRVVAQTTQLSSAVAELSAAFRSSANSSVVVQTTQANASTETLRSVSRRRSLDGVSRRRSLEVEWRPLSPDRILDINQAGELLPLSGSQVTTIAAETRPFAAPAGDSRVRESAPQRARPQAAHEKSPRSRSRLLNTENVGDDIEWRQLSPDRVVDGYGPRVSKSPRSEQVPLDASLPAVPAVSPSGDGASGATVVPLVAFRPTVESLLLDAEEIAPATATSTRIVQMLQTLQDRIAEAPEDVSLEQRNFFARYTSGEQQSEATLEPMNWDVDLRTSNVGRDVGAPHAPEWQREQVRSPRGKPKPTLWQNCQAIIQQLPQGVRRRIDNEELPIQEESLSKDADWNAQQYPRSLPHGVLTRISNPPSVSGKSGSMSGKGRGPSSPVPPKLNLDVLKDLPPEPEVFLGTEDAPINAPTVPGLTYTAVPLVTSQVSSRAGSREAVQSRDSKDRKLHPWELWDSWKTGPLIHNESSAYDCVRMLERGKPKAIMDDNDSKKVGSTLSKDESGGSRRPPTGDGSRPSAYDCSNLWPSTESAYGRMRKNNKKEEYFFPVPNVSAAPTAGQDARPNESAVKPSPYDCSNLWTPPVTGPINDAIISDKVQDGQELVGKDDDVNRESDAIKLA